MMTYNTIVAKCRLPFYFLAWESSSRQG